MAITCIRCRNKNIKEVVEDNKRYYFCDDCKKLYERALDSRYGKDIAIGTHEGKLVHLSVGGLIRNGNKFLLIKRRGFPFGYSFPAGHIEHNEKPNNALKREIVEELGLRIKKATLVFNDVLDWNKCRYGADSHIWYFYECECEPGTPILSPECEAIGWYSLEEAQKLELVPIAQFFIREIVAKDHE